MQTESNNQPATTGNFATALGINTEREDILCDLIGKAYDDTDNYFEAVKALQQQITDSNELAYCLFHLGAYAGSEQEKRLMLKRLSSEE